MRMSQIRKYIPFLHHRIWDDFCNTFGIKKRRLSLCKEDVSKRNVSVTPFGDGINIHEPFIPSIEPTTQIFASIKYIDPSTKRPV